MYDLRSTVEKSNKATQRIEAALSERLANIELQLREDDDAGHETRAKTVQTRDSNGKNHHVEKLKQLEQLAKVYGEHQGCCYALQKISSRSVVRSAQRALSPAHVNKKTRLRFTRSKTLLYGVFY